MKILAVTQLQCYITC